MMSTAFSHIHFKDCIFSRQYCNINAIIEQKQSTILKKIISIYHKRCTKSNSRNTFQDIVYPVFCAATSFNTNPGSGTIAPGLFSGNSGTNIGQNGGPDTDVVIDIQPPVTQEDQDNQTLKRVVGYIRDFANNFGQYNPDQTEVDTTKEEQFVTNKRLRGVQNASLPQGSTLGARTQGMQNILEAQQKGGINIDQQMEQQIDTQQHRQDTLDQHKRELAKKRIQNRQERQQMMGDINAMSLPGRSPHMPNYGDGIGNGMFDMDGQRGVGDMFPQSDPNILGNFGPQMRAPASTSYQSDSSKITHDDDDSMPIRRGANPDTYPTDDEIKRVLEIEYPEVYCNIADLKERANQLEIDDVSRITDRFLNDTITETHVKSRAPASQIDYDSMEKFTSLTKSFQSSVTGSQVAAPFFDGNALDEQTKAMMANYSQDTTLRVSRACEDIDQILYKIGRERGSIQYLANQIANITLPSTNPEHIKHIFQSCTDDYEGFTHRNTMYNVDTHKGELLSVNKNQPDNLTYRTRKPIFTLEQIPRIDTMSIDELYTALNQLNAQNAAIQMEQSGSNPNSLNPCINLNVPYDSEYIKVNCPDDNHMTQNRIFVACGPRNIIDLSAFGKFDASIDFNGEYILNGTTMANQYAPLEEADLITSLFIQLSNHLKTEINGKLSYLPPTILQESYTYIDRMTAYITDRFNQMQDKVRGYFSTSGSNELNRAMSLFALLVRDMPSRISVLHNAMMNDSNIVHANKGRVLFEIFNDAINKTLGWHIGQNDAHGLFDRYDLLDGFGNRHNHHLFDHNADNATSSVDNILSHLSVFCNSAIEKMTDSYIEWTVRTTSGNKKFRIPVAVTNTYTTVVDDKNYGDAVIYLYGDALVSEKVDHLKEFHRNANQDIDVLLDQCRDHKSRFYLRNADSIVQLANELQKSYGQHQYRNGLIDDTSREAIASAQHLKAQQTNRSANQMKAENALIGRSFNQLTKAIDESNIALSDSAQSKYIADEMLDASFISKQQSQCAELTIETQKIVEQIGHQLAEMQKTEDKIIDNDYNQLNNNDFTRAIASNIHNEEDLKTAATIYRSMPALASSYAASNIGSYEDYGVLTMTEVMDQVDVTMTPEQKQNAEQCMGGPKADKILSMMDECIETQMKKLEDVNATATGTTHHISTTGQQHVGHFIYEYEGNIAHSVSESLQTQLLMQYLAKSLRHGGKTSSIHLNVSDIHDMTTSIIREFTSYIRDTHNKFVNDLIHRMDDHMPQNMKDGQVFSLQVFTSFMQDIINTSVNGMINMMRHISQYKLNIDQLADILHATNDSDMTIQELQDMAQGISTPIDDESPVYNKMLFLLNNINDCNDHSDNTIHNMMQDIIICARDAHASVARNFSTDIADKYILPHLESMDLLEHTIVVDDRKPDHGFQIDVNALMPPIIQIFMNLCGLSNMHVDKTQNKQQVAEITETNKMHKLLDIKERAMHAYSIGNYYFSDPHLKTMKDHIESARSEDPSLFNEFSTQAFEEYLPYVMSGAKRAPMPLLYSKPATDEPFTPETSKSQTNKWKNEMHEYINNITESNAKDLQLAIESGDLLEIARIKISLINTRNMICSIHGQIDAKSESVKQTHRLQEEILKTAHDFMDSKKPDETTEYNSKIAKIQSIVESYTDKSIAGKVLMEMRRSIAAMFTTGIGITKRVIDTAADTTSTIISKGSTIVSTGLSSVANAIPKVTEQIKMAMYNVSVSAIEFTASLMLTALETIASVLDGAISVMSRIFNAAKDAIEYVLEQSYEGIKSIIQYVMENKIASAITMAGILTVVAVVSFGGLFLPYNIIFV